MDNILVGASQMFSPTLLFTEFSRKSSEDRLRLQMRYKASKFCIH